MAGSLRCPWAWRCLTLTSASIFPWPLPVRVSLFLVAFVLGFRTHLLQCDLILTKDTCQDYFNIRAHSGGPGGWDFNTFWEMSQPSVLGTRQAAIERRVSPALGEVWREKAWGGDVGASQASVSLWLSQVEGTARAKALREGSEHEEERLTRAGGGVPAEVGGPFPRIAS